MPSTPPTTPEPHPVYDAPGCGIAGYTCLLFIFFSIGMFGIIMSSIGLFSGLTEKRPFYASPGRQVEVWRLQPMRDAKLLSLTEIPVLYHDESRDGTKACALTDKAVLRLANGEGWKIPYSSVADLQRKADGKQRVALIVTKDKEELPCFFEPAEGVDKFMMELRLLIEKANTTDQ